MTLHVLKTLRSYSQLTYHDLDYRWDGYAWFDILCLFVEVLMESTNIISYPFLSFWQVSKQPNHVK